MMNRTAKMFAMLSLSVGILVGGAVSSFAAAPASAALTSRTNNVLCCENTACREKGCKSSACTCGKDAHCCKGEKSSLVARFQNEDGTTKRYTICSEDGKVNGVSTLKEVKCTFSTFSNTAVYKGTLDNGETVMTVNCAGRYNTTVDINKEAVEGYDLYVVNTDGTQTRLEVGMGPRRATFTVDMSGGPVLIHMVEQAQ